MTSTRFARTVAASFCFALLLAPAGVTAQDGEISFPPDSGWWHGKDFTPAIEFTSPVVLGAVSSGTTAGPDLIISHSTSGSNRLILVGVSINNDSFETVSSITYDGLPLTHVGSRAESDDARVEIWALVDPPLGTHDVVITFSADLRRFAVAGVATFSDVDQADPLGTFTATNGTSSLANAAVPTAPGELVFGVVSCETCESVTFSTPASELWNVTTRRGREIGAGSILESNGPQETVSASLGQSDHWALAGISIRPSPFTPADEPPVANDDVAVTPEDTPITIEVAANDNDPNANLDPGSANTACANGSSGCLGAANGTLVDNGDGSIQYAPDLGFNGTDSFVYEICDTDVLCDTATVTVTVGVTGGVQRSFRIRDDSAPIDTDGGWLAAPDSDALAEAEQTLRLRFELDAAGIFNTDYKLQFSRNSGPWTDVPVQSTPVLAGITPAAVESTPSAQFADGVATVDVLSVAAGSFVAGEGDAASNAIGTIDLADGEHTEVEFAVRIRKFFDDAGSSAENVDGTTFDFRVVESDGTPLLAITTPRITVESNGLVGGTYAESPGDLLVEDTNGNLYFPIEDWEATARIMMMKSSDGGVTWQAQDVANRPDGIDMESAATAFDSSTGTIHLVHDRGGNVVRHQFRTSDNLTSPDTWGPTDETVQTYAKPAREADQWVSAVLRSNGDLVVAYNGPAATSADHKAFVMVNSGGLWGSPFQVDDTTGEDSYFPWLELGANDEIHIAYMTSLAGVVANNDDAALTYKTLSSFDLLTANADRITLRSELDTGSGGRNPIAGIEYFNDAGSSAVTVAYLELPEKDVRTIRIEDFGIAQPPRIVTDTAVESGQGASKTVEAHMRHRPGTKDLHLVYVDTGTHDVWHTAVTNDGNWSTPDDELQDNVDGAWVRGLIFTHAATNGGATVFGYVYDAGTGAAQGGQGPIYYSELELPAIVTGDPPVVVDDTASTNEDTAVVIDVVGNDSDVDGDLNVASAEPTTAPTSGVAVGNGDGTITYTPDENFNGSDTFLYEVCDATALCDSAHVWVSVTAVPDAPVASNDTASTNEDTAVVIDVVGNDSDVDGDLNVASAEPTTAPTSGVAVGNGDGTITYTPDENFNGSDTFDYQVCDPTALCDTATVTVTVAPANQAPVVDAGLDTDGEARTAISLDATVTDDGLPSPPGAITTLWTVEPGAPGTATFTDNTAIDTTASFDTPGTYTFRLTADDSALTGDDTVVVTVTDPPLMADFSGTPTTGPAPLTVVFTDLSTGAPTSWAWDFDDGNTSTAQNPTHTYSAAGTYTVTLTATNAQGSDTAVKTDYITVTEPVPSAFYVSFKGDNDVGGLEASDEDILWYDGTSWTTHFDGSDMGVTGDLKAFHIIDGQHILMAFSDDIIIGGVTIDDHDIALFTATSLGENTTGAFSLFFDGDAAGLTTPRDDIDAIHLLPDGRLVLSTRGAPSIAGVAGLKDEDLFALAPAVPGDYTSGGSWEMYFDASDVGISGGGDIVAVSITANGDLYLSVNKTVTVGDLVVDDEDVFVCTPISLGQTTRCDFAPSLYFDGSLWALGPTDIDGLAVP